MNTIGDSVNIHDTVHWSDTLSEVTALNNKFPKYKKILVVFGHLNLLAASNDNKIELSKYSYQKFYSSLYKLM